MFMAARGTQIHHDPGTTDVGWTCDCPGAVNKLFAVVPKLRLRNACPGSCASATSDWMVQVPLAKQSFGDMWSHAGAQWPRVVKSCHPPSGRVERSEVRVSLAFDAE